MTIWDILKQSDKWLALDPVGASRKKKERSAQFPILEKYIVEWIERANDMRVHVTDHVLLLVAEKLSRELMCLPVHAEDYSNFKFSNGWLGNFKSRHGLDRFRYRDEGGEFD